MKNRTLFGMILLSVIAALRMQAADGAEKRVVHQNGQSRAGKQEKLRVFELYKPGVICDTPEQLNRVARLHLYENLDLVDAAQKVDDLDQGTSCSYGIIRFVYLDEPHLFSDGKYANETQKIRVIQVYATNPGFWVDVSGDLVQHILVWSGLRVVVI